MTEAIGKKIRTFREMRNYTQEHLAASIGISQQHYSALEKGEYEIAVDKLMRIAEVLGVSASAILDFDEKVIFNNSGETHIQSVFGSVINQANEKLIKTLEKQIALLEEKIEGLEKQIPD